MNEERVECGELLGVKLRQLWKDILSNSGLEQREKIMTEAQRIENIIVSRNLNGINYEKLGEIKKATELYEANVRDRFDGSHPYERLRIIYTREGRFSDAIRACESYIAFGQDDPELKNRYKKTIDSLRKKAEKYA